MSRMRILFVIFVVSIGVAIAFSPYCGSVGQETRVAFVNNHCSIVPLTTRLGMKKIVTGAEGKPANSQEEDLDLTRQVILNYMDSTPVAHDEESSSKTNRGVPNLVSSLKEKTQSTRTFFKAEVGEKVKKVGPLVKEKTIELGLSSGNITSNVLEEKIKPLVNSTKTAIKTRTAMVQNIGGGDHDTVTNNNNDTATKSKLEPTHKTGAQVRRIGPLIQDSKRALLTGVGKLPSVANKSGKAVGKVRPFFLKRLEAVRKKLKRNKEEENDK